MALKICEMFTINSRHAQKYVSNHVGKDAVGGENVKNM